jgi:hypothetical protein
MSRLLTLMLCYFMINSAFAYTHCNYDHSTDALEMWCCIYNGAPSWMGQSCQLLGYSGGNCPDLPSSMYTSGDCS